MCMCNYWVIEISTYLFIYPSSDYHATCEQLCTTGKYNLYHYNINISGAIAPVHVKG